MTFRRAPALLAFLVVLSSCSQYLGAVDLHDLQSDPASQLRMPATDLLGQGGKDRTLTPDGPSMAFYGGVFGTQASKEEVLAFYERELTKLGWTRYNRGVNQSTTDLRVDGWCKPRVTFRLAIVDQDRFAPRFDSSGRRYSTIFNADLVGVDPGEKCPGR